MEIFTQEKLFDNRSGVAATIEAAKELSKAKLNAQVYVGCTVQEEMGLRGAKTLAYSLGVDDALLLEELLPTIHLALILSTLKQKWVEACN